MMIEIVCENCGKLIKTQAMHLGKRGRCPKCHHLQILESQHVFGEEGDEFILEPESKSDNMTTRECTASGKVRLERERAQFDHAKTDQDEQRRDRLGPSTYLAMTVIIAGVVTLLVANAGSQKSPPQNSNGTVAEPKTHTRIDANHNSDSDGDTCKENWETVVSKLKRSGSDNLNNWAMEEGMSGRYILTVSHDKLTQSSDLRYECMGIITFELSYHLPSPSREDIGRMTPSEYLHRLKSVDGTRYVVTLGYDAQAEQWSFVFGTRDAQTFYSLSTELDVLLLKD